MHWTPGSRAVQTPPITIEKPVSARTTFGGLTHFFSRPSSVCFNSLNTNVIASALGGSVGVCDNLRPTARKLLILKSERCPSG
jgi:hypothetical protein